MKVRSKAPLRLGLAGGGTDVSPYSDEFGGRVLNATINMYAHCFIDDDVPEGQLILEAADLGVVEVIDLTEEWCSTGPLKLLKASYKRIMNDYNGGLMKPLRMVTYSDAPPGSGLGSSSTMVVSIIEGLRQLLSLPLGEYDIAKIAYEVERIECNLSGGKQDQYAATFGGFNYIEFYQGEHVIVNPLRIRRYIISELESSLILFFTGASRDSARIIEDQVRSIHSDKRKQLDAMHQVKKSAETIKELLFKSDIPGIADEFRNAWKNKKATSESITTPQIDRIESAVIKAGAKSIKVSGAGGGGFMMIFVEPEKKVHVLSELEKFDGQAHKFQFTDEGVYSWTI